MTAKKPAAIRQRGTRTKDVGTVSRLPVVRAAAAPLPAEHWAPEVAEGWHELWSSPLADPKVLKPTDVPALRRLFEFRHQLVLARQRFDAEPEVVGSMGQPVLSPWAGEIHRLEGVISKLEDRFGLTPLARLRLGVTFEEGVSLAQRNAQLLASLQA
jgi:hypothetical protein